MSREGRRAWLVRGAGAALLAAAVSYVPYHLYARSGMSRYLDLRSNLAALRAENDRLRVGNERLVREIESLRGDPRAVERVARAELGWVKRGEWVVDLRVPESAGPAEARP